MDYITPMRFEFCCRGVLIYTTTTGVFTLHRGLYTIHEHVLDQIALNFSLKGGSSQQLQQQRTLWEQHPGHPTQMKNEH